MPSPTTIGLCLRPYSPGDLPALVRIDAASFAAHLAWHADYFASCLKSPGARCIVADWERQTIGYILTNKLPDRLLVSSLAVLPEYRRQDVATFLVKYAMTKDKTGRVVLEVSERNLGAQLLFRKLGFKAVGVRRGALVGEENQREDAYGFEWRAK